MSCTEECEAPSRGRVSFSMVTRAGDTFSVINDPRWGPRLQVKTKGYVFGRLDVAELRQLAAGLQDVADYMEER